jgi:hypothetical protein
MHAECPCCNKAEEDIHHILNCEERYKKKKKYSCEKLGKVIKMYKIRTIF